MWRKVLGLMLGLLVLSMTVGMVSAANVTRDYSKSELDEIFRTYYNLKVSGKDNEAQKFLESRGFKHLGHKEMTVKVPRKKGKGEIQPMGGDYSELHLSIDWNVYNSNGKAKLYVTYQWTWDHIEEFEGSPDKVAIAIPVGYWDGPTNQYPYHWLLEVTSGPYYIGTIGVKSYEVHCESGYDDLAEDSNRLLHICRVYAEVYDHYNIGTITLGFDEINPEYYGTWIKSGFSYVHTWDFGPAVEYPLELGGLLISTPTGTLVYGAVAYAVDEYIVDKYLKGGWYQEISTDILLFDGDDHLPPGATSTNSQLRG